MRSCCAVYVDVGYLLAAAATRVTGSSLRRGIQADYDSLIAWLGEYAEADSGLPLLRVNWYDAGGRPGGMPDASQDDIGQLPRVKLRLGRLSYSGEQKGVDVRIGLDLAIQARQHVADVVYLVSGDDDLTEAVEDAQSHGVQVVLLAVPRHDGKPLAVSKHLLREVDRSLVIDQDAIDAAFRPSAIPEALVPDLTDSTVADAVSSEVSLPSELPAATAEGHPEASADSESTSSTGVLADGATTGAATDVPPTDPAADRPGSALPTAVPGPPRQRRRTVHGVPVPPPSAPGSPHPSTASTPATPSPTPASTPASAPTAAPASSSADTGSPRPADEAPPPPSQPSRGDAAPSLPSPAMFARRKAGGVALPGATVPVHIPDGEGVTLAVIDAVAQRVVAAWCTSATPESLATLRAAAPVIPSELDRALLVDLAGWSDTGDLDDATRHEVRARFWFHIARVKPV